MTAYLALSSAPHLLSRSALQPGDYSKTYSFLTAGPVGSTTNAKMILIADLGHTELDYSDEYDYDVSSPPCGC